MDAEAKFALANPVAGAAEDREVAKKARWKKTKPQADARTSFIEDFIVARKMAAFPAPPEDLADENRDRPPLPTLWVALAAEIERAFAKNARPPAVTSSFFANVVLTSHDQTHGEDVVRLPPGALTPDRILAHVLSAPVRLDPRVAASIARRTCLLLLNQARWVGGPEPAPPAAEELDEDDTIVPPEPEMCMDCGAEYPTGVEHRCGAPGASNQRERAKPLTGGVASSGQPSTVRADRPVPARAASTPPDKTAAEKLEERRAIAYARNKVDQAFFKAGGIGHQGEFIVMRGGIVLEVLEPTPVERADQEHQVKRDQRQLVVVRWQGKARLVFNSSLDRVEEAAFRVYQQGEIDAARTVDGSGSGAGARVEKAPGA